jgi:predicted acylesterase/phospholipase RssA
MIATTNLDSARSVVWSIGRIANSGHPRSLELVHDILLASAAIPGVFPPVLFDVEADGRSFDEMHVDGGTVSQVFLFPIQLDIRRLMSRFDWQGQARLYVVRNAKISPEWRAVDQKLFSIAQRSIATLIRAQGKGDLYRLYLSSLRDTIDFNLAYIPDSFTGQSTEIFDQAYMNNLFDLGYTLASRGYAWEKSMPGFEGERGQTRLLSPEPAYEGAPVHSSD